MYRLSLLASLLLCLAALAACGEDPQPVSCEEGETRCGDSCVVLASDAAHCGACGVTCGADELCMASACVPRDGACEVGETRCEGACVDTSSEATHCGRCGESCAADEVCVEGTCQAPPVCGDEERLCGAACVDTSSDAANCGGCERACEGEEQCVAGVCELRCDVNQIACGDECINPLKDIRYCGASGACRGADAGVMCAAGEVCAAGVCQGSCGAALETCGEVCADLTSDIDACGGCEVQCARLPHTTPTCEQSACGSVCESGFGDCNDDLTRDGCEAALNTSLNCGACGNACAIEPHARAACGADLTCGPLACAADYLDCDGDLGRGGTGCEFQGTRCPVLDWMVTFGDGNDDLPANNGALLNLTVDAMGNVYGAASVANDLTIGSAMYDFARFGSAIIALSPRGVVRWSTRMSDDIEVDVAMNGDVLVSDVLTEPATGDVFVVGTSWGGALEVNQAASGMTNDACTAFVTRLAASDGGLMWTRTFPEAECSSFTRAAFNASGELWVVGSYSGTFLANGESFTALSGSNAVALKLSAMTGETLDALGFGEGEGGIVVPYGVAELTGGDLFIGGIYQMGGLKIEDRTLALAGAVDVFYARFAADKSVSYARSVSSERLETLSDVAVGPSGDVYIGGIYGSALAFGGGMLAGASSGVYVARLDAMSGDGRWLQGQQGGGNVPFTAELDLVVDASEQVHLGFGLTATSSAITFGGVSLSPGSGARVFTLDGATGDVLEGEELLTANNVTCSATGFGVSPSGQAVVGGYYSASTTIDGRALISRGGNDLYWAQLKP